MQKQITAVVQTPTQSPWHVQNKCWEFTYTFSDNTRGTANHKDPAKFKPVGSTQEVEVWGNYQGVDKIKFHNPGYGPTAQPAAQQVAQPAAAASTGNIATPHGGFLGVAVGAAYGYAVELVVAGIVKLPEGKPTLPMMKQLVYKIARDKQDIEEGWVPPALRPAKTEHPQTVTGSAYPSQEEWAKAKADALAATTAVDPNTGSQPPAQEQPPAQAAPQPNPSDFEEDVPF